MSALRDYRKAMTVNLPDIDQEGVNVSRFEVSPQQAQTAGLRAIMNGGRGRIDPGTYTRLEVDGVLWMSDTPDEMRDHMAPYTAAERYGGRVLINGLGLGMVLGAILSLDNVEHVDVVERDERIARLIGEHYASDRCTIHHADAFDIRWPAGTQWTVAWHDVWPTITGDNWESMKTLHRRYGRRTVWQGSWARWHVERAARGDRALGW